MTQPETPSKLEEEEQKLVQSQVAILPDTDPKPFEGNLYEIKFGSKCIRWIVTVNLILTWICLGLNNEIIPPCVKGLVANTNGDMERFGFVMSIRGVGYFLGSIFGGFTVDLFPNCMLLQNSISLLLFAVSCFTIPLCRQIDQMSAAFCLAGIAHATLTTSGNPLIGKVWANTSKGVFNLVHSGYGFGAILTPILIYIMYRTDTDFFNSTINKTLSEDVAKQTTDNFVPAFYLVGVLSAGMALITLILFIGLIVNQRRMNMTNAVLVKKEKQRKSVGEVFARLKRIYFKGNQNKSSGVIIFLVFLVYCNLIGNDKVTNKYLYVYVDSQNNTTTMGSNDALIIQISYWIGFSFTRFISFFLLQKIPIFIFYQTHITCTLLVCIVLNFVSLNRIGLMAFIILFAIIKAPLYPTGMSLIILNGSISGLIIMLINVGASIGSTLYPYLAGYLIKKYSAKFYTIILFGSALALFIFGTMYSQILRRQIKKNAQRSTEILPDEEPTKI